MPSPWRCRAQYVLTTTPRDITSAVVLFTSGNWFAPRCASFPFLFLAKLADKDDDLHDGDGNALGNMRSYDDNGFHRYTVSQLRRPVRIRMP